MPGLLSAGAKCPKCNRPIEAIVRTSGSAGVTAEYFHEKGSPKARRVRRCKVFYAEPVSPFNHALTMFGSLT